MPRRWPGGRWPLAAALVVAWGGAFAQDAPVILVVDQERLFQESLLGQRITAELEERTAALAAENRIIEAELVAEERTLTERRAELEPAEFRALADAFDDKVERLRDEQDAKTRDLVTMRDTERQAFSRSAAPILLDFMRKTGATVMLDRRTVIATSDRADVTDELIAELDATVGAAGPPAPAPPAPAPGDPAPDPAPGPPAPPPAGETPAPEADP